MKVTNEIIRENKNGENKNTNKIQRWRWTGHELIRKSDSLQSLRYHGHQKGKRRGVVQERHGEEQLKKRGVTWGSEYGQRQRGSHRQREMERQNKKPHTSSWSQELRERDYP